MGKRLNPRCAWACGLAAVGFLAFSLGSSRALARAPDDVIEADREALAEAQEQFEADDEQAQDELSADRIEIEVLRRKLKNDVDHLRERLTMARDRRIRAALAEYSGNLNNPRAIEAIYDLVERSPDQQLKADIAAIEQVREIDNAAVRAARGRLAADQARWRRILKRDRQQYLAARAKLSHDLRGE